MNDIKNALFAAIQNGATITAKVAKLPTEEEVQYVLGLFAHNGFIDAEQFQTEYLPLTKSVQVTAHADTLEPIEATGEYRPTGETENVWTVIFTKN
tara:strand:- start:820 stop:1107 length:288 start_codon:yes stop_codon:yes gene_type:complete